MPDIIKTSTLPRSTTYAHSYARQFDAFRSGILRLPSNLLTTVLPSILLSRCLGVRIRISGLFSILQAILPAESIASMRNRVPVSEKLTKRPYAGTEHAIGSTLFYVRLLHTIRQAPSKRFVWFGRLSNFESTPSTSNSML